MLKVLQSRPREHKRPLLQIVGKEAHAIRNILVLRTLSDMHMVSPALPFYIDARFRVANFRWNTTNLPHFHVNAEKRRGRILMKCHNQSPIYRLFYFNFLRFMK